MTPQLEVGSSSRSACHELELLLTPIKDPGHPFPFLHTMEVSLAVALKDKNPGTPTYAVVSLPGHLPRLAPVRSACHASP